MPPSMTADQPQPVIIVILPANAGPPCLLRLTVTGGDPAGQ